MNLHKLCDETEQEYIQRICSMKNNIGTWQDVADIVNAELGTSYSESRYRKAWKLFNPSNKEVQPDTQTMFSSVLECTFDDPTTTLIKERQKLTATKTEYMRLLRQQSRFELFYENVKEVIQQTSPPSFKVLPVQTSNVTKQYLVTLSDIHYGSNFEAINNSYSIQECERRFEVLLNELVAFIMEHQLSTISIVDLGDDIQGILRLTDLKLNEVDVVRAVVGVSKLISSFLNELSAYCNIDYYHVLTSNHSQTRPLGTKASELASEDMEFIIVNYIKDTLAQNPRVTVHYETDKGYMYIPVFDFNVLAMHGHTVKSINTILKDMTVFQRRLIDYTILGHYHSKTQVSGNEAGTYDTEVIVAPALIGSCPYADTLYKGAKAASMVLGFDQTRGLIDTHKIIVN